MSKIRVYELARELNLTNKVLMDKLINMGIPVGSHMSSLDDEAVTRAKAVIFGKKARAVEDTRVKPTVIRRRRKVAEPEAGPAAAEPEPAREAPEAGAAAEPEPAPAAGAMAESAEAASVETAPAPTAETPEGIEPAESPAAAAPLEAEAAPQVEPSTPPSWRAAAGDRLKKVV